VSETDAIYKSKKKINIVWISDGHRFNLIWGERIQWVCGSCEWGAWTFHDTGSSAGDDCG